MARPSWLRVVSKPPKISSTSESRSSVPVSGWTEGMPILSRETCSRACRSTVSHSKQRGNVVGYAYRPAARIVCAVSRPLASAASTVPISRPAYSASPEKNTAPPSGFRSADCASRVLGVA